MTDFLQLLVAGIAVGALYALVALGFVIIYKSTGVINFAQGALLLLGAYFCFGFTEQLGWNFYLSAFLAMVCCGFVGIIVERLILSRMVGQPVFAVIMITIGLSIAFEQTVIWRWTGLQRNLSDPWGLDTWTVGEVVVPVVNVVRIVVAGILLLAFFLFFRYSRLGVAMRATASDQEAALAQGISAKRIFALSWAVAAAIAGLAGVLLASGGRGIDPTLGIVALVAFPAIILGGLDSPAGAIVGGVIVGVVETMTAGYSEDLPEFLGHNFNRVTPYVVLVAILLIRPYGLFGTKEVRQSLTAVISRLRRPSLTTDYADDLKLFRSKAVKLAMVALVVIWLVLPGLDIDKRDFWLSVLNRAGLFAIGALALNLLTGYTGQVSLGHAFFLAIGAYTWAHFGAEQSMSLLLWLPLAGIIGAAVGALVGPFALRLRGNYLAIVSLGLVFIGTHIWNNFESVTGGASGVGGDRAAKIGGLNFADLQLGGKSYTVEQAYFWLIWFFVAVVALIAKNVVRTRPGRAMQAVRDRDVAAEIIGVNLARYKVGAFALSSGLAAVGGALFGSYYGYISPDQWNLLLSIQFIAIIIVGGVGTIFGSVLGALFIAGTPPVIEEYANSIPLVSWLTEQGGMSTDTFNQLLYGVVIVLFLVLEPHGLAGIWFRIKAYFKTWPFSY